VPAIKKYNKYAIILGAGASYGARFKEATPPLDWNFLEIARDLLGRQKNKRPPAVAWRKFCKTLKKAQVDPKVAVRERLEYLSTYLEAKANMNALQLKQGRPQHFRSALDALSIVICHVLQIRNGTAACSLHRQLFEHINPSAIISFNYDLIADQTLMEMRKLNFTHREYCSAESFLVSKNERRPVRRRKMHNRIPLLKLHGSINWQRNRRRKTYSVVGRNQTNSLALSYNVPDVPFIVPPLAAKIDISNTHLKSLWSSALKRLKDAPGWIIWGYSLPATDTITQVLCRTALSRNKKPKHVIVINPDFTITSKMRNSLSKIRITHYISVERFLLDQGKTLTGG